MLNLHLGLTVLTSPYERLRWVFLKSLGRDISLAIEKEFKEYDYRSDLWPGIISKEFEANTKSTYGLMQALNDINLKK